MKQENNNQADPTRERILDEAERLFARKGYDAVTVREITSAAGANLAAVNYYFGHKQNLYLEVFRSRWMTRAARVRQPLDELAARDEFTLEEVVHTMAYAFLRGPLTSEERMLHTKLIAREMESPTEAFQVLVNGALKPMLKLSCELIQRSLPHPVPEERLKLISLSMFSQVLYFNFARPVVTIFTGREYETAFVKELVEHITNFALHGLEAMTA